MQTIFHKQTFPCTSLPPLEPDPIPALKLGLKELTHWDSSALDFISPSSIISECFYTTFQVNEISLQKGFACVHCFQSLKKPNCINVKVGFLKIKSSFRGLFLNFILPCAADIRLLSFCLDLRNELVDTSKVEGRLDQIILLHAQGECSDSTSSRSPQKVALDGIQGCDLGHWSEMLCHDFTVTDPSTQMFWIPDGVTEISQIHFSFICKSTFST